MRCTYPIVHLAIPDATGRKLRMSRADIVPIQSLPQSRHHSSHDYDGGHRTHRSILDSLLVQFAGRTSPFAPLVSSRLRFAAAARWNKRHPMRHPPRPRAPRTATGARHRHSPVCRVRLCTLHRTRAISTHTFGSRPHTQHTAANTGKSGTHHPGCGECKSSRQAWICPS